MTAREFYDAVVEMRRLQRIYDKTGGRDKYALRCKKDAEDRIDKEIARVELLTRERMQPRLNFD